MYEFAEVCKGYSKVLCGWHFEEWVIRIFFSFMAYDARLKEPAVFRCFNWDKEGTVSIRYQHEAVYYYGEVFKGVNYKY
jgi:hypothetical protein